MAYVTDVKYYDNKTCPLCGHISMSASVCRLHEANICMDHCETCQYLFKFMGAEWHCTYRPENDRERAIRDLYGKHGIERKSAIPEGTALKNSR